MGCIQIRQAVPLRIYLSLRDNPCKQPKLDKMFPSTSRLEDEGGLRASYNTSFLTAESGKTHTVGLELLLAVLRVIFNTVLRKSAICVTKKIFARGMTLCNAA
ncbi:hypothetical protein M514_00844, partial [Trichuris suis]